MNVAHKMLAKHGKTWQDHSIRFDVLLRICGSLVPSSSLHHQAREVSKGANMWILADSRKHLHRHFDMCFICFFAIDGLSHVAFRTAGVNGEPAIYDPCAFYGHAEAEFGMSWCADLNDEFWRGKTMVPLHKSMFLLRL